MGFFNNIIADSRPPVRSGFSVAGDSANEPDTGQDGMFSAHEHTSISGNRTRLQRKHDAPANGATPAAPAPGNDVPPGAPPAPVSGTGRMSMSLTESLTTSLTSKSLTSNSLTSKPLTTKPSTPARKGTRHNIRRLDQTQPLAEDRALPAARTTTTELKQSRELSRDLTPAAARARKKHARDRDNKTDQLPIAGHGGAQARTVPQTGKAIAPYADLDDTLAWESGARTASVPGAPSPLPSPPPPSVAAAGLAEAPVAARGTPPVSGQSQVRIGQVNVIVAAPPTPRAPAESTRAEDSASRLFLRSL